MGDEDTERYARGLDPNISASDYTTRMSALRENAPRPIHKLWNNPDLAPPERVAEQKEKIKAWNREYRKVSKNQKLALARDNEAFYARQRDVGRAHGGRAKPRADRKVR